VFHIYEVEIKKAQKTGNWDIIFCRLILFVLDFFDETWIDWICWFTKNQAFWTTLGPTTYRITVGWNIEIIFMFLMAEIVFGYIIEGVSAPKQWILTVIIAFFCVFIECVLNLGGHLTWVYPWWNLAITGVWLIFFVAYGPLFFSCLLVFMLKSNRKRLIAVGIIYFMATMMNIIA
jgi:hypothetical protein